MNGPDTSGDGAIEEDRRLMRRWLATGQNTCKRDWLDHRCNSFFYDTPSGTLEVSRLTPDGSTRWRPWLEVRDDTWWAENCNQMSIPHTSLLVDIDPAPGETPEAFNQRIEETKAEILRDGGILLSDCFTGSRGRHLEFHILEWANRSRERVRTLRGLLLQSYNADLAKASPRCMILIPGMPNPKTGRKKVEEVVV